RRSGRRGRSLIMGTSSTARKARGSSAANSSTSPSPASRALATSPSTVTSSPTCAAASRQGTTRGAAAQRGVPSARRSASATDRGRGGVGIRGSYPRLRPRASAGARLPRRATAAGAALARLAHGERAAAERLAKIRATDPKKLAFFTGRDQSQALTAWWAQQFGTPNYAAHGGFCSVNMAAAGLYTIGGSFWEFGEPDWNLTKYLMLFGVAEDHDSNPIKIGLGKLKSRGAKIVAVNPCRTGYNAIADEWIGIRPGTDGLFILALVHELLKAGRVDLEYLVRYTNAHALVICEPNAPDDGLFLRDSKGHLIAWDNERNSAADATAAGIAPALTDERLVLGRRVKPV